jgi:hypothetical protein
VKQKLIFHPTFVLLRDITVPLSTFEHPTEEQVPFRIKSKCKIIQISNSSNFIFNLIFFYIKNPQKYAENEIAFKINFKHLMFNNYSIITLLITNIINKS